MNKIIGVLLLVSILASTILVNAEKQYIDKDTKQIVHQEKLEKGLLDKMLSMNDNDKVKIAIWVKTDDKINKIESVNVDDAENWTQDQVDQYIESHRNKLKTYITEKQKPILDKLKNKNIKVTYSSSYAPIIFTEVTKSDIQELEKTDDIIDIELNEREYKEMSDSSVPSTLAPIVWSKIKGGARVAIVEKERVAFQNPYIKDGVSYNPSATPGGHATAVAGIIASTNSTYRGVAYKGPAIFSANAGSLSGTDLVKASDWALSKKAQVLMCAWGSYTGFAPLSTIAKYYDYISRYSFVTVVFPSGNCGACVYPQDIVADPGRAYNVITVGSYNDQNTGWIWDGDTSSPFSSYRNNGGGGVEKPEVMAPGEKITTTTISSPWIGNKGQDTSFAAAHVAGEASLLINNTPVLALWPEAVKAIIMASANHNIVGNTMINDQDGVGAINILEAQRIASKSKGTYWNGTTISYGTGETVRMLPGFSVTKGQTVRVVLVWSSMGNYVSGTDYLNTDLSFRLERYGYYCDDDGYTCDYGWMTEDYRDIYGSAYDNFEIIEFNSLYGLPIVWGGDTTKYRILITKQRWDNKNLKERIGFAVYVK